MILELFALLLAVSLVMVIIGLSKPTESAQAIIGFFFIFLLSFVILNNNLEVKTGVNINTTYSPENITISYERNVYEPYGSRYIGIYLALAGALGLAGVLYSLKK